MMITTRVGQSASQETTRSTLTRNVTSTTMTQKKQNTTQIGRLNLGQPLREDVDPLHEGGGLGGGQRIGVEGRRRAEHQSLFERLAAKSRRGRLNCVA